MRRTRAPKPKPVTVRPPEALTPEEAVEWFDDLARRKHLLIPLKQISRSFPWVSDLQVLAALQGGQLRSLLPIGMPLEMAWVCGSVPVEELMQWLAERLVAQRLS